MEQKFEYSRKQDTGARHGAGRAPWLAPREVRRDPGWPGPGSRRVAGRVNQAADAEPRVAAQAPGRAALQVVPDLPASTRFSCSLARLIQLSGLLFSHKSVEKLFFDILITHLSEDYDLQKAAIVVNLQGGISSVFTIIMAFLAHAYVGLFKMLISSFILCITGLVLIVHSVDMFYFALVLMTLSTAAIMVTLESFLDDQREEEKRSGKKRIDGFGICMSVAVAFFSFFWPPMQLTDLARILAIMMGAALFLFLLGFKFYNRVKPTGSPLSDVLVVIRNAIINTNVAYPQSSEQLHQNPSHGDVQILPHVSWLRWVDRVAVVQENGICSSVEQVMGVKYLLRMVPMWSTFITFSLVYASGDTFFLEEASSIITDHDTSAILLFTSVKSLIELIVPATPVLCLVRRLCGEHYINAQKLMLVRIGIGMLCCVLCCIAAWTQADHRLDLVDTYGDARGHMNVYRLTLQFLLLGFMGGLSSEGLEDFFKSQVSSSMFGYGQWLGEFVIGIGKFVSVVCILILSKWFQGKVESSRLDKYYCFLVVLSSVNFVTYCLVAQGYGDDTFAAAVVGEDNINSSLQILIIGGEEEQRESSPLLSGGEEEQMESSPLLIGGEEEQRESSLLLSAMISFPPSSRTRGLYKRFHSMS
ncbi:hypothetical protein C2S51_008985 [Perilla frutescens var. frutescens]|nr:hypothetical protein C2S51_008985 [Perilla frutescens var. frutescens]